MCAGGPPKPVSPIHVQSRAIVLSEAGAAGGGVAADGAHRRAASAPLAAGARERAEATRAPRLASTAGHSRSRIE